MISLSSSSAHTCIRSICFLFSKTQISFLYSDIHISVDSWMRKLIWQGWSGLTHIDILMSSVIVSDWCTGTHAGGYYPLGSTTPEHCSISWIHGRYGRHRWASYDRVWADVWGLFGGLVQRVCLPSCVGLPSIMMSSCVGLPLLMMSSCVGPPFAMNSSIQLCRKQGLLPQIR